MQTRAKTKPAQEIYFRVLPTRWLPSGPPPDDVERGLPEALSDNRDQGIR
jgi:hypothetical protein